ncbi:hypothetical protein AB0G79_13945 [Streptomyces sp. NPDC020807]|uniref:hypothetical protein n=1 Tax=Streptomyces sp. NPDC020807 TaxID=3155119 RepID=UPI00340EABFF
MPRISRRVVLLATAGSTLALPVVRSGTAYAATPLPPRSEGPSIVTHPRDPGAVYGSDAARSARPEPLNATVGCAVDRGGRR